jgi:hypothetical protein
MMEKSTQLIEMSNEQRRIFIDAGQLHEALMDALVKSRSYRGGMHWKQVKGNEYLFRSLDRRGYGKSLGPRSAQTEAIHTEFHNHKKQLTDKLRHLQEKLKEQARFCKAARIARVPKLVTAILRLLEQHGLLGHNLQVIGTNALYAYEASAGVFFERGLTATQDMDVLWDVRSRLRLSAADPVDAIGLMGILHKADRSFALLGKRSFRAVNRSGYMVDLVKPEPKSAIIKEKRQLGKGEDLVAAEIRNLHWLAAAPKFAQVVIGQDGYPANMVAPDPRAFALHKLWLSRQPDREPVKRQRDHAQSLAVCKLVLLHLPNLQFDPRELRMFPKAVITEAKAEIDSPGLPPGYGA